MENLLESSQTLKLGNKVEVWAYNAKTLELINDSPFYSLQSAASYFNVNYRTINRHLDKKLATTQNKTLVYFFKKEINSDIRSEFLKNPTRAHYARTEIWVYKVDENGGLNSNQFFKTKREAIRVLGIHVSVLNKYLDSSIIYKGLLIFSEAQTHVFGC